MPDIDDLIKQLLKSRLFHPFAFNEFRASSEFSQDNIKFIKSQVESLMQEVRELEDEDEMQNAESILRLALSLLDTLSEFKSGQYANTENSSVVQLEPIQEIDGPDIFQNSLLDKFHRSLIVALNNLYATIINNINPEALEDDAKKDQVEQLLLVARDLLEAAEIVYSKDENSDGTIELDLAIIGTNQLSFGVADPDVELVTKADFEQFEQENTKISLAAAVYAVADYYNNFDKSDCEVFQELYEYAVGLWPECNSITNSLNTINPLYFMQKNPIDNSNLLESYGSAPKLTI